MKKILFSILIPVLFISAKAQNWETFTTKYYYFNGKFEKRNILPAVPSSITLAGNTWIVNASQPFTMNGDAKTPTPGFIKGLTDMGFNTKKELKILYAPSGMVYVHSSNFFAYKKIEDAKWQGFSIDPKAGIRATGPVPNLGFALITSSTIDNNGNLIIAGIKNDLPAIATLKDNQWNYFDVQNLVESVPVQADKHSKFNITLGGIGFGSGPDGFTFIDSQYIKDHTAFPMAFFVYSLMCDKENNIWFLSDNNLWSISANGMYQRSTERINFINLSAKGEIYAATDAEIKKFTNNKFEPIGLPWKIKTFYVDANDALWFVPLVTVPKDEPLDLTNGFKAGIKNRMEQSKKDAEISFSNQYLRRYDIKNKLLFTFTPSNSPFAETAVNFITSNGDGKVYFVAPSGIYILKEPTLNEESIWSADYEYRQTADEYKDKKWCASFQRNENESLVLVKNKIGFYKDGKVEYKDLSLIPAVKNMSNDMYNYFSAVSEDKKGNIYIGTQLKGLFKYGEKGCTSLNMDEKIAGKKITCLTMDKNDNLWIGTDKVLAKYDGKSFTYYDKKNSGMENSEVNALFIDDNNLLWIATDGGLYNFDGNSWNGFNKKNNGLKGNKIEALTGFKNKIYFAASDELYSIENGNIVYEAENNKKLTHVLKNGLFMAPSGNLWVVARGITIAYKEPNGTWTEYDKKNSPLPESAATEMTYVNGKINICLKRSTWGEINTLPGDVTGKDSQRFYTLDNEFIMKIKTK